MREKSDTINVTNEQLGIAVCWKHRSFKEQGVDRKPTIHIEAIADALERKGIQTERGNINRKIIRNNKVIEMIAKEREGKGRLDLPVVSGKHLRKISDSSCKSNATALDLQSDDDAEGFITTRKTDSFESFAKFTADEEQKHQQLEEVHFSKGQKLSRLKELSKMYALYKPIQATYKESQSLKGFAKMKLDKDIKTATELAYAEVIGYNKKNFERELQNESWQQTRQ